MDSVGLGKNKHTYAYITMASQTKMTCNLWHCIYHCVWPLIFTKQGHCHSHLLITCHTCSLITCHTHPLVTHHKNCCTTSPLTHPNTWTNSTWSIHPLSPYSSYLLTYPIFPFGVPIQLPTLTLYTLHVHVSSSTPCELYLAYYHTQLKPCKNVTNGFEAVLRLMHMPLLLLWRIKFH